MPLLQYMTLCTYLPQVSELDFQDSIMVLGFSEELNKELLRVSSNPPLLYFTLVCSKMTGQFVGFGYCSSVFFYQLYQENCHEIRSILSEMSMDLPHYHNLEWRLDVQLASRALQRQAQPSVLFRLHTRDGGGLRVLQYQSGCLVPRPTPFSVARRTRRAWYLSSHA